MVPLSASTNVEELALTTTATVTNSQYSDYGFLLVGAVGNVLTLLGNDTAQVGFTVGSGGSADIAVNANATGAVLSCSIPLSWWYSALTPPTTPGPPWSTPDSRSSLTC